MKKKLAITFVLAVAIFGCGKIGPITLPTGTITIEAQTLPIKIGFDLTPNPSVAGVNIISYNIVLDGSIVATQVCAGPATCQAQFLVGSIGTHNVALSANYTILNLDLNSVIATAVGPATTFIISQPANAPAVAPANLKKN